MRQRGLVGKPRLQLSWKGEWGEQMQPGVVGCQLIWGQWAPSGAECPGGQTAEDTQLCSGGPGREQGVSPTLCKL